MLIAPIGAATISGMKDSAWTVAQITTQRCSSPKNFITLSDTSCMLPPTTTGRLATNPDDASPIPNAKANAGK